MLLNPITIRVAQLATFFDHCSPDSNRDEGGGGGDEWQLQLLLPFHFQSLRSVLIIFLVQGLNVLSKE